jgi:hypothetical protein
MLVCQRRENDGLAIASQQRRIALTKVHRGRCLNDLAEQRSFFRRQSIGRRNAPMMLGSVGLGRTLLFYLSPLGAAPPAFCNVARYAPRFMER